jgi:hypothetical protein
MLTEKHFAELMYFNKNRASFLMERIYVTQE